MIKRLLGHALVLLFIMAPAIAQDQTQDTPENAVPAPVATETATAGESIGTDTPEAPAAEAPDTAPVEEATPEAVASEGDSEAAGEAVAETADGNESPGIEGEDERFVVICPIDGEIDEALVVVVERAVREAKDAEALLFVINTPGGRVDSAIEITTAIMSVECPTIAFVEGMGAISAGAIISYSCDYIYMTEGTNIGASTPIMPGVETTEAMDEKSNSFVRAKYRALGEANGHNPLLGEAMVDRNIEIRGYRTENDEYFIFKVNEDAKSASRRNGTPSGDALDKILDAVSEDIDNDDITEILKKVLGATANEEQSDTPSEGAEEEDAYTQLANHTDLISARGELLTLTTEEAIHVELAAGITTDVDDTLREFFLGSVNRMTITPTWEEALFALLTSPTIAGLLLMAGLGGIYVEVRTPGFGAPGIIGTTCLALFFGSHMVIGMTNWIDVVLILVGFLLILAEIFLLPGFGLAGILGFLFLIGGAYLALVKTPLPEFTWEFTAHYDALYTLTVTILSFVGFVVVTGLLLPLSPLGKALVLNDVVGYPEEFAQEAAAAMGLKGVAISMLRPAGKGRFGTTKYDVVTRGEFIDEGTPIRIIESSGNRHVVTAVTEDKSV